MNKLRVAVIFGGKSAEHEVSLQSAKNIIAALDKDKYNTTEILIPKSGDLDFNSLKNFDVVFPVLHGTNGEDGTIQGLLKLAGIPFVGADVLGSAVGMDKDVQKRLLRDAGIPIAKFITINSVTQLNSNSIKKYPVFVKPANCGSSVGITKAHNKEELIHAIELAKKYDSKVLIEEAIVGREIEVSVLGNEDPIASLPGEILPSHEFYDYDAKYIDENGAVAQIPAKLTKSQTLKIQKLAIKTYKTLCCEGLARVDMFLTKRGNLIINEINTLPGFTNISMYPKLWEASGLSQSELLDKLIDLALNRQARIDRLKNNL